MFEGEVDRYSAAARASDHRRLLDAEVVEQVECVLAIGELHVLGVGLSVATGVEADDEVIRGERRHLRIPHPQVGDAGVEEEQGRRRDVTVGLVVELCAVDVEMRHVSRVGQKTGQRTGHSGWPIR